jgi:hypothetical protein
MATVLTDNRCLNCGIPVDAEYFDASGFIGKALRERHAEHPFDGFDPFAKVITAPPEALPEKGEQKVLASFQLHPQYCGVLTYFSQYTDLYARDNTQILTPGFEWIISQNGKPVFPYLRLDMIMNPWGYNCLPVAIRLDENARVEFVIRNRSIKDEDLGLLHGKDATYPIRAFAGRIMGRYWYNEGFGGR